MSVVAVQACLGPLQFVWETHTPGSYGEDRKGSTFPCCLAWGI